MKCCVLFASPRRERSNTRALLAEFLDVWRSAGHDAVCHSLYEETISPCVACRGCQRDWSGPNCVIDDDMTAVFEDILACDLLLLASPIYLWSCTAPMKAALDRCIYALCKYYGDEKGADLWQESLRRICKHARLRWLGLYGERRMGYKTIFMDQDKAARARDFARRVMTQLPAEE